MKKLIMTALGMMLVSISGFSQMKEYNSSELTFDKLVLEVYCPIMQIEPPADCKEQNLEVRGTIENRVYRELLRAFPYSTHKIPNLSKTEIYKAVIEACGNSLRYWRGRGGAFEPSWDDYRSCRMWVPRGVERFRGCYKSCP